MKTTAQKIISVLLSSNVVHSRKILHRTTPEWFDIGIEKRIFEAAQKIHKRSEVINVVTIAKEFRTTGDFSAKTMGIISKYSADYLDALILDSLLETLEGEYHELQASKFLIEMQRRLANKNLLPDEFLMKCKEMIQLFTTQTRDQETNEELIDKVLKNHDEAHKGELPGIELGLANLSEKILLEDVDMMVIGGRPAMGKTAFAITIMCTLAFMKNIPLVFFSLEMSKNQIMRRLIAYITDIDSNKIKYGTCDVKQLAMIRAVKKHQGLKNIFIHAGSHTSDDIIRKSTEHKHNDGIQLIIVDYLQKITGTRKNQSPYELVSANSNDMKFMSANLKIPNISLAQLTRESSKVGGRPKLSDLKQSGDIEQDASIVVFLHRPEYYGIKLTENDESTEGMGELIIAKNREGVLGIVKFNVDLTTSKWTPYQTEGITIQEKSKDQDELPF